MQTDMFKMAKSESEQYIFDEQQLFWDSDWVFKRSEWTFLKSPFIIVSLHNKMPWVSFSVEFMFNEEEVQCRKPRNGKTKEQIQLNSLSRRCQEVFICAFLLVIYSQVLFSTCNSSSGQILRVYISPSLWETWVVLPVPPLEQTTTVSGFAGNGCYHRLVEWMTSWFSTGKDVIVKKHK